MALLVFLDLLNLGSGILQCRRCALLDTLGSATGYQTGLFSDVNGCGVGCVGDVADCLSDGAGCIPDCFAGRVGRFLNFGQWVEAFVEESHGSSFRMVIVYMVNAAGFPPF